MVQKLTLGKSGVMVSGGVARSGLFMTEVDLWVVRPTAKSVLCGRCGGCTGGKM